jgi:hypothetical protein
MADKLKDCLREFPKDELRSMMVRWKEAADKIKAVNAEAGEAFEDKMKVVHAVAQSVVDEAGSK